MEIYGIELSVDKQEEIKKSLDNASSEFEAELDAALSDTSKPEIVDTGKVATSRLYRSRCCGNHWEMVAKWRCPACGTQNEVHDDEEKQYCPGCGKHSTVKFRRIRGKRF